MRDFTKVSVAGLCAIFARAAMRSLLVFSCIFTCYGAQGIDDDFCLDEMFGHVGPTDFRETGRPAELAGEIETVMGIARNGVSGCGYYLKGKEHGSDHEQHYTLVFGGETPHNLPSGTKVVLHGKLNGAVLSIKSGSDPTNLQVTAEAPVVEAPSNLSVTVILVNFLDSTLAATPADIDWMVNSSPSSLSKYYFDTSYGKTTVTATVKGPYTINYNGTGSCDYGNWAVAADAKAGVSNGYRLYVLAPSGCGWGGLGYMPGQQCWINGSNWSWQDAYCHEFGHNLGMHHAYYAGYEYADHSDCMGNGQNPPHTNAPHSVQMGWMKAGTVTTISANGTYTYTLSAMENNTSVTQIIKFPKANESGMSYYLSYRAPIGLDASNLEGEYQYKTSVHHYSSGSTWTYLDGLCGDGQTYADAANKVFVTQLSHTATTSTISVRYGVISTPPTVAANASASPNPVTATTAALSVLGADDGGEPSLTYTWSVVSGPGAVSFSANGSNGAKSSTATFSSAGSYVLSATIRDIDTQTVTSNVTVTVNQTLTAMGIAPSSGVVAPNGMLQFTATVNDQFGRPMATGQPSFSYSVGGGGTISSTGLFSAGAVEGGPFTVTASGGGFIGTASILVSNIGTVWVEDSIPAGGVAASSGGDTWSWVGGNPFSGSLCQESAIAAGQHQHYFTDATQTLAVSAGEALFAYVYLDPANPPSEVMLQWYDGIWEHRAYWGANVLPWGTDGTTSLYHMGGLPSAGQWVRLQVQASAVALEGSTLTGMAFTLNDGRAWFDCAGKSSGSSTVAPSITTQPVNQSVTAPATATFSVAASGTPAPTYQWQSAPSGSSTYTAIGGATSTSYTTGATSTAMSGTQYRCVASNSAGIVYSNAVTLTVFGSSQTPIASWTLNDGTGSTAADSSGNGNPGTLMSGPAWTTGRVGNALAFNGTSYLQVADAPILEVGANGGDFSVGYWLYLQQGATGLWRSIAHKGNSDNDRTFAMWMHPDDNGIHYRIGTTNNFNEGGDSVGQVPVNAWTHIAYVKSTNVLKLYINGVQDSQVTLVGASVSNNGPIYFGKDPWFNGITGKLDEILLYNRALSGAEVVALASVGGSTNHAPVITTAADATPNPATAGQTVTLGVAASDSDGDSLSYAWSFGDSTSGSGTSAAHAYAAAGSYTAVATISDGNGGTASSSVGVTVNAVTNAPTITTQPVNRTVTAPATATFSVTASGSPTPTYQWQSAPSGSSTYTAIGGATSASYTTGATSTAMSGNQYRCVASNSAGSATSTAATLTVNAAAVAPAITTQPVNQTVTAPATATFSVTASGSPTPTFQWQSAPSGSSTYTAISGATSTSYTTGATSIAMSGMKYRCVASNSAGSATSTAATLTVNAPATPTASVVVSDAVISETGPDSGSYTITLSSAPAAPVTVSYTLTGRAQNGNDYVTLPTTATIAAGQTTATVTVTPINDSKFEKAETVILTLTSGTGYTVGAPASATLSIQDNDGLQQTAATVTTSTAPKEGGIVTYTAPTNAEWPTDLNTTWTWGDGSATLTVTGAVSANHAFATPGIYTVVATITDPATSATLRETFSVTVTATGSGGGGGGGSGGGGGGGGGCGAGSGLGCLLMVLACLVLPMTRQRGR